MIICVGSTNPAKLKAAEHGASSLAKSITVKSYDVVSGVSHQPMTDEETKRGAVQRALAALEKGKLERKNSSEPILGMGLEGGVTMFEGELWSTVWVVVVDESGYQAAANGARLRLPDLIAQKILDGGEMGPVVAAITGEADVRKKQGMIGIVTNNYVDRAEEYGVLAKLACGIWYGRDWEKDIPQ